MGTHGYGTVSIGGRNYRAHRLAWALHNGSDPGNFVVRHLCHNTMCVNPEHLALGTHKQNSADMVAAGRQSRGSLVHTSKLTESDVVEIRRAPTARGLGKRFGVKRWAIADIRARRSWKHV